MLEVELEQWITALEKSGTKVSCLNGMPAGSVNRQFSSHRIQIYGKHPAEQWRHDYMGEQEHTVWMKQLEEDFSVPCDMRIPPRHVNGKIHKRIVQPAMLHEMETLLMASSHVKKLEGTEMTMCRWAKH